jgi:hypothetical protein
MAHAVHSADRPGAATRRAPAMLVNDAGRVSDANPQ